MRSFPLRLRFWTALALLLYWSGLNASPAFAGLAPSAVSGATAIVSPRDADLIVAQRALENRIVAQKLRDYGVSPSEARVRLASLSDQDLHTLATASKGLPAGGDDAVGTLIALLIVVLLVIIILKVLNKQIIVK